MATKLNKKAVILTGCACGAIAPAVALVTKDPAYACSRPPQQLQCVA